MERPKKYQDKLDDLYTRHHLALEQAEFIYPLHKSDKKNKEYASQFENIEIEFGEINRLLDRLQKNVKDGNKTFFKKNKDFKKVLDETKNSKKAMSNKNRGYDDTERALVEMKNDYKKRQSETFIKALDMTLGIILVCYLIYKKSK